MLLVAFSALSPAITGPNVQIFTRQFVTMNAVRFRRVEGGGANPAFYVLGHWDKLKVRGANTERDSAEVVQVILHRGPHPDLVKVRHAMRRGR